MFGTMIVQYVIFLLSFSVRCQTYCNGFSGIRSTSCKFTAKIWIGRPLACRSYTGGADGLGPSQGGNARAQPLTTLSLVPNPMSWGGWGGGGSVGGRAATPLGRESAITGPQVYSSYWAGFK